MRILRNLLFDKKGSIAVMTAASMFALVGMAALVTDAGVLYLNHSQLENMTDAGALAGAQEYLIGTQASVESVATDYAISKNGKPTDTIDVVIDTTNNKIIVTANRNVDLFFAKIFSMNSADVSSVSAAKIAPVSGMSNLIPFGITWDNFITGQPYTLKVDEDFSTKGNFHNVALKSRSGGDSGASVLEENIVYGCGGVYKIGDKIPTEPGNMVGPIKQAIADRIAIDPIVFIPVISEAYVDIGGGRKLVTIQGFAAFEIKSSDGKTVTGIFRRMVAPADMITDGVSSYDYELYGTMLVDPKSN